MTLPRTIPLLPCRDVDEIVAFYAMLGFARTYRQLRPNPYVVLERDDGIALHFFGMSEFVPANSYSSCLVVVADAAALYAAFADGLRAGLGRVPASGLPRVTRPQRRGDGVRSFSVVDPAGNWIRVTQPKGAADDDAPPAAGLPKLLDAAIGLGDSKGDPAAAAKLLDGALERSDDAAPADRFAALVYRAELAAALGESPTQFVERARAIDLPPAARADATRRLVELEADLDVTPPRRAGESS